MTGYLIKRLVELMVALLIMSLLVFSLARLTGDPVALLLSDYATEEERTTLTQQLGLDKPLTEQYVIFITAALQGDFGNSISGNQQPAMELVLERLPASLMLASAAMIISLLAGVPMGVIAAARRGSKTDILIRVFTLLGQSIPVFWLGMVFIYFFSVQLGWLPTSGYGSLVHLILPATSMALFTIAAITRLTRVSMIDALSSEYIKLARIKGLPERVIIWKHALRNSLIPLVTYMGTFFAMMITGAVVVETVFSWPGIGRLAYQSILDRDFPVMQAVVLTTTVLFMLANFAVDLVYVWIDPRIER
ncbi:ABC transporter permease [Gammaproteobacteria bacterium]|jgi:peptide/nickel transport system permease protein|nr:ABC transporter permease [Gammaproteobacteria bacterium]